MTIPTQNLHIPPEKGLQLLDGKKAEQLVRYRKGNYKSRDTLKRHWQDQDAAGFYEGPHRSEADFQIFIQGRMIFLPYFRDYVNTNITINNIADMQAVRQSSEAAA
jgi:hypothetical protein